MKLKFRCWNGEQMVSPDYVDRDGVAWWTENSISTRNKEVMLFTGLLDKEGKEIYEGDVVRIDTEKYPLCEYPVGYVFFKEGAFYHTYGDRPSKLLHGDCKVIGDIYSTPDLIEKGVGK